MNIFAITPRIQNNNQFDNFASLNKRCKTHQYPNLSPLSCDTVSFCGKEKLLKDAVENINKNKKFVWNPNNKKSMTEINVLCDSFKEPLKKFVWDLKQAMKPIICTESNPEGIIMPGSKGIHGRVKDPKKVIRKANKRNLTNVEQIEKMGDVGGARITLRTGTPQDTAQVFICLKEIIKKGYKVIEVENYRPTPKDSYASQKSLEIFEQYCNKHGQYPSITNRALPNSYTAIHISFELPDGKVIELQIMGRDVENYKEVEDLFYKYRCEEDFSEQYKSLQNMFKKIMPKLDDFQKETLERYHKDSYEYARQIPPRSFRLKFAPEKDFLPFPYSLPPELDPVSLYYQMEKCNKLKAKS